MTGGAAAREIRRAGALDIRVLAALHQESFPDDSWSAEALAQLLAMPGAFALVTAKDGAPIGFIMLMQVREAAEILTLAVTPSARGEGAGRGLVQDALDVCAASGVQICSLEVAVDNHPALTLYAALGFKRRGGRRGYYRRKDGTTADALILSKTIPGSQD
jgi:ribosomal-protein-alanine N-acetyltransferase